MTNAPGLTPLADLPDREYSTVLAHYRTCFNLLDAYCTALEESRPAERRPITEPHPGLDVLEATRQACIRTGLTITDAAQYDWAYAYIRHLLDEVASLADTPPPTVLTAIANHYMPTMGCAPEPGEWEGWDEEEKLADAREFAEDQLTDQPDLLRDVIYHAMPELLRLAIAADQTDRRDANRLWVL